MPSVERKIGTYNGKDLFERVYSIASMTSSAITVDATITRDTVDDLVYMGGTAYNGSYHVPIPINMSSWYVVCWLESTGFNIEKNGNALSNITARIIYTKAS